MEMLDKFLKPLTQPLSSESQILTAGGRLLAGVTMAESSSSLSAKNNQ
jgi:hypothetical protein